MKTEVCGRISAPVMLAVSTKPTKMGNAAIAVFDDTYDNLIQIAQKNQSANVRRANVPATSNYGRIDLPMVRKRQPGIVLNYPAKAVPASCS